MRQLAEPFENVEAALQQQFALLKLEHGLDGQLPESLMRRYVYDFTCMHAPYSARCSREAQAQIMWQVRDWK